MNITRFAVVVLLGLTAGPAFAANKSVIVINQSSHTILQVQATNSGDDNWGENLIADTIAPGSQEDVDLDDGAATCIYDIRVLQRGGLARRISRSTPVRRKPGRLRTDAR